MMICTSFGLLAIEKCFEKTHRTFRSANENLRLRSIERMDPKRRFNVEKYVGKTFCKHFSSLLAPMLLDKDWYELFDTAWYDIFNMTW